MDALTADRIFLDYQNQFRGLAAAFKSRRFVKDRQRPPAYIFRLGYRELLLKARIALDEGQFGPFLEWASHQLETQLQELTRTPAGYDDLAGIPDADPAHLDRELLWVAHRLSMEAPRLRIFRAGALLTEIAVAHGEHEAAIEGLELLETALGASLWGVQLRIALEHMAGGLERQKRYTGTVRAVHRYGVLGFVAYHTSVRNEDKSTPRKFVEHILTRIARHSRYSDDVKTYLRYRLAGQWPETADQIAEILRVEQSHTFIDLYETFVAVAQTILVRDDLAAHRDRLAACLALLPLDLDARLRKIAARLDMVVTQETPRRRDVSDALLGGDPLAAARAAFAQRVTLDVWDMVYAGLALSFARHGSLPRRLTVSQIPRLFALSLKDHPDAADAQQQLGKLAANLGGLPFAAGLRDLQAQLERVRPVEPWRPWAIGLNSPTDGIEDLTSIAEVKPSLGGPTEDAWRQWLAPDETDPAGSTSPGVLHAAGRLSGSHPETAVETLRTLVAGAAHSPLHSLLANLLLHALCATGERSAAIEIIADAGTLRPGQRDQLPILVTLGGAGWPDFQEVPSPLAAPIALHFLWLANEKDITRSQLRFATKAALAACGVDRPSALPGSGADLPPHQLVYFLAEVCQPDVLDILRAIKSTLGVLEERQAILTILRELDPAGAHHYADELLMVAKELTMAEGQWIVDHTRIHVDLVALRRWADRELTEDFERHEDLVSVDIGPQASFEDVLKELSAGPSGRKIQPPETEADAVLQSLVRRLGDEFLTNSQFGLDFYLSKRIRHQSFIGRIRGPLEFANLITTRETEASPYHRNDFWIDQFTTVGADQREAVNAALMNCARDFDEILRDAKDRLFHIRSPEQPDGLISLDLTPEALQLVRTIALWDPEDFSSFFEVAVAALWAALDPSFARVRRFINTDLKSRITERLELARAEVRAAAGQDPAFHNFDIEFGQRSTEVQRALDDAASWFTYTRAERLRRTFTLEEAVRIGRENALRCQRGFNPVITETVHGGIEIMAPSLVIIHDTLFTALDNIRAHSGHKAPKVDVVVSHDPGRETLTVEVMSDCRPQQKMTAERKLKEIQKIIDGAAPTRRTRREGGSGILKLEAVTRQSERGRLDFGFVQGGRFRLAATYAFTFGPTAPRETGS